MPSTQPQVQTRTDPQPPSPAPFQPPKKRRKWLRRVIIAAVVLALLAGAGFLLRRGKQGVANGSYLSAPAVMKDMTVTVTGTGTVKPNDAYRATTLLRGEIITAPFEEGDLVRKDQVLFTLDPTDVENSIRSAESGVSRAELGVEQARLSYNNLLKTQRDNAKNMAVKATADGTVVKLYVDQGDTVAAGTPIAEILDRDNMELSVPFHSVTAAAFSIGQAASVTVDGTSSVLYGTITDISPVDMAIPSGAVVRQVTIRVANPGALTSASTGTAQVGEAASASSGPFSFAASKQVIALMSGKLERLTVSEGSRVVNGQTIGSFELPDLQAQIDAAALNIRSAELALSDAREGLRIARDHLEDYSITSPITGTVIEKNYKAGDNVDATATGYMAVIYDLSRLTFDMNVSELDVSQVKVGQRVTFTSDALEGITFTGHIDKININGSTVSGNTNYPVTVVVDAGEGLYPGMNVSATILVEEAGQVLTVPVDAIQRGSFVYVAGPGALNDKGELTDPDKLEERQVTLGRNDSNDIEVLSGLTAGETVYIPNVASSTAQQVAQMMGG